MPISSTARGDRYYQSSSFYINFATLASDLDLVAASQSSASMALASSGGTPCRRIRITTPGATGTLIVTRPDGTNTTFVGLVGGEILDIQATVLVSAGSTVSAGTVFY